MNIEGAFWFVGFLNGFTVGTVGTLIYLAIYVTRKDKDKTK